MSDPKEIMFMLPSKPGVRRDGTTTDAEFFNDAQWVRFIRKEGRPRKMGGYQFSNGTLSGPARGTYINAKQFLNIVYTFSQYGIEYTNVDQNGLGGVVTDITPAAYAFNANTLWSFDTMYDSASGGNALALLAVPTSALINIDDPTNYHVYWTNADSPAQLVQIGDTATCSGGVFCTEPYACILGNDGNLTWSDVNGPQNFGNNGGYPVGDAGSARITDSKLVKGLPLRSGNATGALIWSLDAVLRMDYVGGANVFKFSHLTHKSSILSQNGVVEYDGTFYWAGIDRFMVSNGSSVQELPNEMNLNWFYDNLNFSQRQKVFAMKQTRWGEIWWFFPFGTATECNQAVIYNIRSQTWYDSSLTRSSGTSAQLFRYPMMTSNVVNNNVSLVLTVTAGALAVGDYVRGATSGAEVCISSITGAGPYTVVATRVNSLALVAGENYNDITSAATGVVSTIKSLYTLYVHEKGTDAQEQDRSDAIPAWFETCDFGLPTGGASPEPTSGIDAWTRITRIEPDFVQTGEMTVQMISREFPASSDVVGGAYTFEPSDGKIDMREQGRCVRLKFMSNVVGGSFEGGRTLVHTELGDVRA